MYSQIDIQDYLISQIHDSSFMERHRLNVNFFTRERPLSFGTIVSLILQKMSKSLQIEANLLGDILNQTPVSKQALSKARYKIGASAFQELYETVLKMHYTDNPKRLWKGYRVFGGDGSTLQFPRRGDIPLFFGDYFKRTCLGRVVQYVELTSDIPVASALMPYSASEEATSKLLLPELVEKMKSFGQEKQIYVYDRGFPSHAFAQRHLNLGVDFLFRVQKTYSREILKFVQNREEANFDLLVSRANIHYSTRVIIRYLNSGEPLVLLTSLRDREQFTDEEIIDLYGMRWRCEESYKFQKVVLQMDNTNCRTYHGTMQEFWATVLLAALMGLSFNEEDDILEKEEPNQHTKANRCVIFGSLKQRYLRVLMREESLSEFNDRFKELCRRHRVPIKPHRSYPRLSVDTRKTRHCYRRAV